MMTRHYKVAGHTFAVSGRDELFELMGNYEPFECEGGELLFTLTEDSGVMPEYTEEPRQDSQRFFICGHTASENNVFDFSFGKETRGCLIWSKDNREGRLIMTGGNHRLMLDRALMIMYALATAGQDTLILHAVVVSQENKGYIFLGPMRTGKSTHARLWIEHIEGAELVNDDFPVVRGVVVYGSPWGSNIPCYRNVSVPIGGMVMLSQATYNKIRRLSGIDAYLNLFVRVWGTDLDKYIAEDIAEGWHQTMDRLVSTIPMWHLECLPDEAAARLCHDTICK